LDRIVYFGALDQTAMETIAQKYLNQLQKRISPQGLQLQLPQELAHMLAERCKEKGGARALRRLVQEEVEGPLASFLLECSRRPTKIKGNLENEKLCFYA
jgi:ATP-dependent Clp protease ATP-binding subunit ClpA